MSTDVRGSVLPKENKKEVVRKMFDTIAPKYDLLNRVLSGGIDQIWRRKAVKLVGEVSPASILDMATGTADLAILAAALKPERIVGVDLAEEMLEIGRQKVADRGLSELISLEQGDAENLRFESDTFDAALVAFGVRNFENLSAGLTEIGRVLRPGGKFVILEFSQPRAFPIKQFYAFYGHVVLPLIGRLVSGDSMAYTYLPESIDAFPDGKAFLEILTAAGFNGVAEYRLTFGIASIYIGYARS